MVRASPPRTITPQQQLDAVPVRHPKVTERRLARGGVCLMLPLRRNLITATLARLTGRQLTKAYELDANGAKVWAACNGKNSVREICASIGGRLELPPEQAKEASLSYIRTLTSRNLIGLSIPIENGPHGSR